MKSSRRSVRPGSAAPGSPAVFVCVGGGGVGKTTTSAALGLALAKGGLRTLIVTLDPARRLAGALGVSIGDRVTPVALPETQGRLFALMPDPRSSLGTFIDALFIDRPETKQRLLKNRLYRGLSDAAAGVHELVAMNLLASASSGGDFDCVVLDTAPSRHAMDFVTYPGRLAALLGSKTVAWLAGIAERASHNHTPTGGVLAWGAGRVEGLLARVTGPTLLSDTASLFGDLASVRERFVALTERASELLLGPHTTYLLVAAPTQAARDDAIFLHKRIDKLGRKPRALILNRADCEPHAHMATLRDAPGLPPALLDAMVILEQEREARAAAANKLVRELGKVLPQLPIVRLPHVEASTPEQIVASLAPALVAAMDTLAPTGVHQAHRD